MIEDYDHGTAGEPGFRLVSEDEWRFDDVHRSKYPSPETAAAAASSSAELSVHDYPDDPHADLGGGINTVNNGGPVALRPPAETAAQPRRYMRAAEKRAQALKVTRAILNSHNPAHQD